MVCLQETKIASWNHNLLVETVGPDMASNAVWLPSIGVCGGILVAAFDQFFKISQPYLTTNIVSAQIKMLANNEEWSITGVYGPQFDVDKILFL